MPGNRLARDSGRKVKPKKENLLTEIVNETIFTICLDLSPIYTDVMVNERHKYDLGWIFIVVFIVLFLANVEVIVEPPVKRAAKQTIEKVRAY